MSMESAKALVEKMKADATFAQQVMSIDGNDARIAFVKSQGYDCTLEEVQAVQSELSDDDLDAAAGGGDWYTNCQTRCDSKDNRADRDGGADVNTNVNIKA